MRKVFCFTFGGAGALFVGVGCLIGSQGDGAAALGAGGCGVFLLCVSSLIWWFTRPRKGVREIVGTYGKTTVGPSDSPADIERMRRALEEPWRSRHDWMSGRIAEEDAGTSGIQLGVHLGIGLVSSVLVASLWGRIEETRVFVFFPVIAVGTLWFSIRKYLQARKYGTSWFEFRELPFWMGERLRAVVRTGIPLRGRAFVDLDLRLSCVETWSTFDVDSHGHRTERMAERALWKHEAKARAVRSPRGPVFDLPLDLALPVGLPSASTRTTGSRSFWRLELHAAEPGIDYEAKFEVPVFARPDAVREGCSAASEGQ